MKKNHLLIAISLFFALSCRQDNHNRQTAPQKTEDDANSTCMSYELLENEIATNPQRAAYLDNLEEKIKAD